MTGDMEERLRGTWDRNAERWSEAVRSGRIDSRRLVTDRAIVETIVRLGGQKILDVGCGEGWLARALGAKGLEVTGFDGTAALVESAQRLGGATFMLLDYSTFASDPMVVGTSYDVAVCNFSLLDRNVRPLLEALRRVATAGGHLVVQTVHPAAVDGGDEDGWREEKYESLPGTWEPMPWYFKTSDSWAADLRGAGWSPIGLQEPVHPHTGRPVSLIILARRAQLHGEPGGSQGTAP
ncbi:MAG: class I SAM-dependent methyltransferase [Longimicrobiales bacterium]